MKTDHHLVDNQKYEILRKWVSEERDKQLEYINNLPKEKAHEKLVNEACLMGFDHVLNLMDMIDDATMGRTGKVRLK